MKILNMTPESLSQDMLAHGMYDVAQDRQEVKEQLLNEMDSNFESQSQMKEFAKRFSEFVLLQNSTPMVENKDRGVYINPSRVIARYLEDAILTLGLAVIYKTKSGYGVVKEVPEQTPGYHLSIIDLPEEASLDEYKMAKMNDLLIAYQRDVASGVECFPTLFPGVKFSIKDESISKMKGIVEYAEISNLTVVPFLYDINSNRLENVPVSNAKLGVVACFERAMFLYDKIGKLNDSVKNATTKEQVLELVW